MAGVELDALGQEEQHHARHENKQQALAEDETMAVTRSHINSLQPALRDFAASRVGCSPTSLTCKSSMAFSASTLV